VLYFLGVFQMGVSSSNYERIEYGMSRARVQLILGPGKREGAKFENEPTIAMWSWESLWGKKRITIVFRDSKAYTKAYLENGHIIDMTVWDDPFHPLKED
jgi:hypothetical protein